MSSKLWLYNGLNFSSMHQLERVQGARADPTDTRHRLDPVLHLSASCADWLT